MRAPDDDARAAPAPPELLAEVEALKAEADALHAEAAAAGRAAEAASKRSRRLAERSRELQAYALDHVMLGDEPAARAALAQKAAVADALAQATRRAEANSALARKLEDVLTAKQAALLAVIRAAKAAADAERGAKEPAAAAAAPRGLKRSRSTAWTSASLDAASEVVGVSSSGSASSSEGEHCMAGGASAGTGRRLVLVLALLGAWALAGARCGPCAPRGGGRAPWSLALGGENCTLALGPDAAGAHQQALELEGPGVVTLAGDGAFAGLGAASLRDVVLVSERFPTTALSVADLLWPPLLAARGAARVNMTNVQVVYRLPPGAAAGAVAALRGVVSDPVTQQAVASWALNLYTDYSSFAYVAALSSEGLACRGCGVFLEFGGAPPGPTASPNGGAPGVNYALGVTQAGFGDLLSRYATLESARPFLVLLGSNVTWGGAPLALGRPLVLVGQAGRLTSVDLGMRANQVSLAAAHANLTMDGLVVENLGYGDRQSGNLLSGLSLVNTFNLWFFLWDRSDVRLVSHNVTHVAARQAEVDYLSYWAVMFGATDPVLAAEAAWLKRGPGITLWEVRRGAARAERGRAPRRAAPRRAPGAAPDAAPPRRAAPAQAVLISADLFDVRFASRSATASNTWRSARRRVASPVAQRLSDPELYAAPLKVHAAAPLAALASSNASLQAVLSQLSGLPRDGLAVVMAPALGLGPDGSGAWPPPGGVVLKAPRTTVVGYSVCQSLGANFSLPGGAPAGPALVGPGGPGGGDAVEAAGPLPQEALLQGLPGGDASAVRATCDSNGNGNGGASAAAPEQGLQRLAHSAMLDLGGARGLVRLAPAGPSGKLELGSLTLAGLAQGPAVVLAAVRGRRRARALLGGGAGGGRRGARWAGRRLLASEQQMAADAASAGLTQASPDVWTHLVWAVERGAAAPPPGANASAGELVLTNVQLLLPPPEFARLLAASRAAPGGAFTLELSDPGGAAPPPPLRATASRLVDDCCLLVSNYSAPGLTASELLLVADPDEARAMPPGYLWPFDGTERQGELVPRAQRRGASALGPAAVAGVVIGAVLGAALLAALVLLLVRRRQRRRRHAGASAAGAKALPPGVRPGGALGGGCDAERQPDKQHSSDASSELQHSLAAPGSSSGAAHSSGDRGGGGGGGVLSDKRWLKLTSAISGKVQDIHTNRLKSALLESQAAGAPGGAPSLAGAPPPRDGSPAGSTAGAEADDGGGGGGGGAPPHGGDAAAGGAGPGGNVLQLKEIIGQGSFGTVYRATWQGVNVAVKLLQLPPGACAHALTAASIDASSWDGGGGTSALASAVTASARGGTRTRLDGLLKQEHMAVQEAAIGSTMVHPNIVSVYSIALRPAASAAAAGIAAPAGAADGSGVLLLDAPAPAPPGGSRAGASTSLAAPSTAGAPELLPWEMQLVLEYCDQGTLRQALDAGLLVHRGSGLHHLPTVLSLAHNVGCAMTYLHQARAPPAAADLAATRCTRAAAAGPPARADPRTRDARPARRAAPPAQEHIIHGDLKASNVLLKTSIPSLITSTSANASLPSGASAGGAAPGSGGAPGDGAVPASHGILGQAAAAAEETNSGMHCLLKGGWVVAKVSDFGLSLCVDPGETHVSSVHAGTLTHMAPELLMQGRCSRASDVYSFGILVWELATGGKAFAGIPKPLLGHCIVSQQMRPCWPAALQAHAAWAGLLRLAEACWSQDPQARPTFAQAVAQLDKMIKQHPTEALSSPAEPAPAPAPATPSASTQQAGAPPSPLALGALGVAPLAGPNPLLAHGGGLDPAALGPGRGAAGPGASPLRPAAEALAAPVDVLRWFKGISTGHDSSGGGGGFGGHAPGAEVQVVPMMMWAGAGAAAAGDAPPGPAPAPAAQSELLLQMQQLLRRDQPAGAAAAAPAAPKQDLLARVLERDRPEVTFMGQRQPPPQPAAPAAPAAPARGSGVQDL
ncbi:HT1 [Scenedesmus sp. PABB004]|nr:HT1 [Scenedesmus sp. PABB004]